MKAVKPVNGAVEGQSVILVSCLGDVYLQCKITAVVFHCSWRNVIIVYIEQLQLKFMLDSI
jgi:hypothetical protein